MKIRFMATYVELQQ